MARAALARTLEEKMIVRHYIACETCGHAHTLRIQVGHLPRQEHIFHCANCGEDIEVAMNCFPETASVEIKEGENCVRGQEEGTIINLSPEFPIAAEDLHRDMAFPSMDHIGPIAAAQHRLGVRPESFSDLAAAREHAINAPNTPDVWSIVKKGWSLANRGLVDLATEQFKKYPAAGFDGKHELDHVVFDFVYRLLQPGKLGLFKNAGKLLSQVADNNRQEFTKFKAYYRAELKCENFDRYFEVFSEYFKNYADFSQTLIFHQHAIELDSEYQASSTSFKNTKLFYGNAFEALTSNIAVLACLNNIKNGREFDQFEKMDLKKHLNTNKANRDNPFKDVPEFSAMTSCLDSTLRNASHHGAMKLLPGGRFIEYRSGGTGAIHKIGYREYIDSCNSIMLSCCGLLALECVIAF